MGRYAAEALDGRPFRGLDEGGLAADWLGPLRGDDDTEPRPHMIAIANAARDLLEVVRDLRDQDYVRAACHAGIERDPPGIPPHYFHDDHAVMGFRRHVQAIDGIGGEAHRAVEAERVRGLDDIVVDR